ncbi:phosphodiester glycosidase family protein [Inhella gelatinilytica]|uniref:Phosphodiester glycosidase family protein n=1 Tax=Inhella gelatinilytica TaxID=2795030 RepID=A0A931ITS1_9BURK|nr:phosphodiester glycosidase family protein [Inhella gelatinilytica]MBH9552622.1 phosphodiester glycosidase family protein [Inhella gelatinilytica]
MWPLTGGGRAALERGLKQVAVLVAVLGLAGCVTPRVAPPAGWQAGPPLAPGLSQWRAEPGMLAVKVDLRQRRLRLSAYAERGRVLDAFEGAGTALAAVNVSFFDRRFQARGHTVSQGQAWPEPLSPQTSPLLACQGEGATQRCTLDVDPPFEFPSTAHTVLGGTPWLLRDGQPRTAADDAKCAALCAAPHPRTALGLSADGQTLVLLLVEGRRAGVPGLSLAETARHLRELGAWQGLNLDGGGSSSLLLHGVSVMQRPANEPQLRRIANALLIE